MGLRYGTFDKDREVKKAHKIFATRYQGKRHIRTLNVRIIQNEYRETEYVAADWIVLVDLKGSDDDVQLSESLGSTTLSIFRNFNT
jgi:hypothetical protein